MSALIFSCAQVVAPGGGKTDNDAPKVVKYSPDSAQLNFNSQIIELTFDEYVQLRDLNNQLIISPPLESTPDFHVKNKILTIDLGKEELKTNTTYSINFGNAIQDINENNAKENFSYLFSTGNFIDSLKVTGRVQNTFDHKAEKGVLAMLYSNSDDSSVFKNQPAYFARTAADGTFQINNVKEGKYKIITVKDANGNYRYDPEAESIGFYDSLINASEKKNIQFNLFQEPAKKIFIKKYLHNYYGKIVLTFNQGSDSIRVTNLTNDRKGVQEFIDFSKNKDTLTYWIKNYEKDSLKLQVNNGNIVIDTVEFKMIKFEDAVKARRTPLKLRLMNSFNGNQNFDLNSDLRLIFSQPISNINNDMNISLQQDSISLKSIQIQRDSVNRSSVLIKTLAHSARIPDHKEKLQEPAKEILNENTKYSLFIPPGTFTDIFGLTNDTIKIEFKTRELKFYGSLKLKVDVPEAKGKYIIQLLDEKENIVRENIISETETIYYDYLHPKKYKVKMILDENANSKWDTGNYLKKIQPEKVIYNPEEITIRSNWDAEIEWKITGTTN